MLLSEFEDLRFEHLPLGELLAPFLFLFLDLVFKLFDDLLSLRLELLFPL